jgi:hypothetical protein
MEEMRDLLQAAEAVIQAGLALHTSAEAVETREGFVQFVGALRQYLEDFLPGLTRCVSMTTWLGLVPLPPRWMATTRKHEIPLRGAFSRVLSPQPNFRTDGSPRMIRSPRQ